MTICHSLVRTGACFLFICPMLFAEPESKPGPPRHLRLLALGDSPTFRQVIRDGVRYEAEPPAGSIPPREVILGFDEEASEPIPLSLGRISEPVKVPVGAGTLSLRRSGEGPESTAWLKMNRPENGDFLALIWRASPKVTWENAVSLIVPDGRVGAPAGTVQIANLFPRAVRVMWGEEALTLPARKTIRKNVQPGAEIVFQILVPNEAGRMTRYYSSSVMQNAGERGFVVIYQADGEMPRRPVKVLSFREPVVPAVAPAAVPDSKDE